jgi:hypothetical protein
MRWGERATTHAPTGGRVPSLLVRRRADSTTKRHLSKLITAINYERQTLAALAATYRSLADAMAWSVLEFNRAVITSVGDGTRVGHLQIGPGLDNELRELEWLWEHRGVFGLLRDILSVELWHPQRSFRLTECKTGGSTSGRAAQQFARLERLTALLNDGRVEATRDASEIVVAT